MGLLEQCGARDVRSASRTALVFFSAALVMTVVWALGGGERFSLAGKVVSVALPVALVAASLLLVRHAERVHPATWCGIALVGIAVVTGLNLGTSDASFGAQVIMAYPVVYAAHHLRPLGVVLVTVIAEACHVVVVLTLEPAGMAMADAGYFLVTVVSVVALIATAAHKQEQLVTALRQQAAVDALTGLSTRRVLDEVAECALAETGAGTALVLLDVDLFKTINDSHGHPVGDAALRHLSAILTGLSRPGDVLSRIGGDEVAVLLPGCPAEVAERRAAELVDAVRASPLRLRDGALLHMTVSVGFAHAPRHATNLRDLYAAADRALYVAKRRGRDRWAGPEDEAAVPAQPSPVSGR